LQQEMKLRVYPQITPTKIGGRPPKSLHGLGQGGDSKPNLGNPAGTSAGEDYQRWSISTVSTQR